MSPTLSPLDWIVVVGYLLAVGAVGVLVGRGQRSTRDYFLGGRGLPWWAATLSILATETSAVTFIGLPAAGYLGERRRGAGGNQRSQRRTKESKEGLKGKHGSWEGAK